MKYMMCPSKKTRLVAMVVVILVLSVVNNLKAGVISEKFVRDAGLDSLSVAVMVMDLSNSEVVESFNASTPLIPASIMKSVTIASLCKAADIEWRYNTRVNIYGKVRNGVLEGNLEIVGSGDPSLNSPSGPASGDIIKEIVDAVRKHKIDTIAGTIQINQTIFTSPSHPETWAPGDKPHAYGAGCFGLNFRSNRNGKSSVANPANVFESELKRELGKAGIVVEGGAFENESKKTILNHKSAPLDEIMRSCMMRSDNLFAEALLRTYALAKGKEGDTAEGAALEMDYWKKQHAPMQGVKIVDGSGLSRSNRVTAEFMTHVLKKLSGNAQYASFFPLCGQEGTLKHLLKGTDLEGYLAMKTGSMNGIQCYAGYKLDDDYAPTHVVVVIINNMKSSRDRVRSSVATMLTELFE